MKNANILCSIQIVQYLTEKAISLTHISASDMINVFAVASAAAPWN